MFELILALTEDESTALQSASKATALPASSRELDQNTPLKRKMVLPSYHCSKKVALDML
jgi:hypothetical protein